MKPYITAIGFVKSIIDTDKNYKKLIMECDQSYVYNEQEYISFCKMECIYYEKNEQFKVNDLVFVSGVLTLTTKEDKNNSIMCSQITNLSDSIELFYRRKKDLATKYNNQKTNNTSETTNQPNENDLQQEYKKKTNDDLKKIKHYNYDFNTGEKIKTVIEKAINNDILDEDSDLPF